MLHAACVDVLVYRDGSTANIYHDIMRETTAGAPSHAAAAAPAVRESFASDLDERALDIVLGHDIASQQYKVELKFLCSDVWCRYVK